MFDLLVIDDSETWREIIVAALNGICSCDFTTDYDTAVLKIRARQYRAVCLNWKFHSLYNGLRLLTLLREQYPDIPVVLVSGEFEGGLLKIKSKYPNVREILVKGSGAELREEAGFVLDLLDIVSRLVAGQVPHAVSTVPIPVVVKERGKGLLSWLHLSDLHLRDKSYEQDKVLKQLLEDVDEEVNKRENWKPDFIVVTGDIAFSAQPAQYQQAGRFFDKLLKATKLPKERLFLIPGNHDVDWNRLKKFSRVEFSGPDEVIEFFRAPEAQDIRKEVFSKFENYAAFVNSYLMDENGKPIRPFDEEDYFYSSSLDTKAGRVVILGLNSAWASALRFDFNEKKADDEGHLLLGEPQVDKALKRAKECKADIVIALLHHPLDWLKESDRNWAEHPIREGCSLILHGHLHKSIMGRHIVPESDAVFLGAGTAYEERDHRNCYHYVDLDLATRKGIVYLRRYVPEKGGGWVPDSMSFPHIKSDKYLFDIP